MQNDLPLGSMVNEVTKNSIWANEYIKLGTLLPKLYQQSGHMPIILDNDLSAFDNVMLLHFSIHVDIFLFTSICIVPLLIENSFKPRFKHLFLLLKYSLC